MASEPTCGHHGTPLTYFEGQEHPGPWLCPSCFPEFFPTEPVHLGFIGRGADLIAAERRRQVEQEGWTPAHDDEHEHGEMVNAACCYAWAGQFAMFFGHRPGSTPTDTGWHGWPWDESWWKPSDDPIRNLVKAGALIAAEIDRLQRALSHLPASDAQPAEPTDAIGPEIS